MPVGGESSDGKVQGGGKIEEEIAHIKKGKFPRTVGGGERDLVR